VFVFCCFSLGIRLFFVCSFVHMFDRLVVRKKQIDRSNEQTEGRNICGKKIDVYEVDEPCRDITFSFFLFLLAY
jgi:hypothetical protein